MHANCWTNALNICYSPPKAFLHSLNTDISFCSYSLFKLAEMITCNILFFPRNAYFRNIGKGFNSSCGASITDGCNLLVSYEVGSTACTFTKLRSENSLTATTTYFSVISNSFIGSCSCNISSNCPSSQLPLAAQNHLSLLILY